MDNQKEWNEKYYQKHKIEILKRAKKWRLKNLKHVKEHDKKYYQKNRERILLRKEKREIALKRELNEQIGNTCIICGKIERLCFHEIHGKPHKKLGYRYILNHKENFTRIKTNLIN